MSLRVNAPPRPGIRQRGFTMVELLVALAITLLIAGLILGLTANSLGSWGRSQGMLTAESEAHGVLDRLAQDLQGALYRDDGGVWFAVTVQADAGASGAWVAAAKPPASSLDPAAAVFGEARFGVAGVWLRFFTTAQGADFRTGDPAAPVAVSYQIIRRSPTPSGDAFHYLLYRSVVAPSATFAAGYDLSAPDYSTAPSTDVAAGCVQHPGGLQVIADNVIDFGVRLYGPGPRSASGGPQLMPIFPVDAANLDYQARLPSAAGGLRGRFPLVVDLMLRVLTPEGARQIAALESGQITGEWWTIAVGQSKVFTRRVTLIAAAP